MGCCASHANRVQPILLPTKDQYQKRISALLQSSPGGGKSKYGRRNSFIISKSVELDTLVYDDATMVAAINDYVKSHP